MSYSQRTLEVIEERLRARLNLGRTYLGEKTCLGNGGIGIRTNLYNFHIEGHWYKTNQISCSLEKYTKPYEKFHLQERFHKVKQILVFPLYDKKDTLTDIFWLVRLIHYRKPKAIITWI